MCLCPWVRHLNPPMPHISPPIKWLQHWCEHNLTVLSQHSGIFPRSLMPKKWRCTCSSFEVTRQGTDVTLHKNQPNLTGTLTIFKHHVTIVHNFPAAKLFALNLQSELTPTPSGLTQTAWQDFICDMSQISGDTGFRGSKERLAWGLTT